MSWTMRRMLISAFVVGHLGATTAWNLPDSGFKARCVAWAGCYLLPLGLWQNWGMFAPDPVRDTLALEAVALDRRGLLRTFSFVHAVDYSPWQGPWVYRHSKFATGLVDDTLKARREYAARHVARNLGVGADDFPLDVQLLYQVRPTRPPSWPADGSASGPASVVIDTYRFDSLEEAQP